MLSLLSYRCASRNPSKSLVLLSSLKPGLRSIKTEGKVNSGEYEPLLDIIARRREESGRSVMVQVKGKQSAQDLYTYCSTAIGHVKGLHFYKNQSTKAFTNFYIVEFEDESCVAKILSTGSHSGADSGTQPVPVTSPFLWFSGAGAVQPDPTVSPPVIQPLPVFNDVKVTPEEKEQNGTISDQIYELWNSQDITESNLRARFMVCRQVELTMKGMFSHAAVLPFGSSVNGFGQLLGDQDMILSLDPLQDKGRESRLVFHSKSCVPGDRAQTRRYCDQISSILQIFLPGCQDVQKILFARVPIIKYRHELTGFDCDLSMTSSSGLYMSCLLHIWGGADWRVRPLVSVIKHWAKSQKLVKNIRPTNYFTNFTLVMLVICYLQQVHGMVPSVQKLTDLGSSKDQFSCEDGVSVNFLHNINPHLTTLNQCYHSDMTLFELLRGFFEFYSHFEFNKHALNTISGETEEKNKLWPKTSALDILNPLEPDLNVSYNVNLAAVKMFKDRCTESRKKCDKMSEQGDNLATLFGKEKDPAVLAMPKMFDVGLGKSRAGDNKLSNTPGRTNHKSKSREISLNLDSIFSETESRGDMPLSPATEEQRRLDREKSIRSTKHVPVFKQHF